MADDKTSSKIEFDVTEARKNIALLNQSIRLAESEFKLASAGMDDWSKSNDGLQAKQKQLTTTITAQRSKIALLEQEYDEVCKSQGENSKAAADLRIKINAQKTKLVEQEKELESVNTDIQNYGAQSEEAGTKTDSWKEKLDPIAEKLKKGFKVACAAAAAAVAAVSAAVVKATKDVVTWATEVGQAADDVLTLAEQTGVSAEELQKWQYASNFIDTNVEDMAKGMKKVTVLLGNAGKGATDAKKLFKSLGVQFKDSSGNLRDSEDVFWDMIDALNQMDEGSERDALAMQIFGEEATKLNPLINAGSEAYKALGEEAVAVGAVMSDEALSTAGAYNDAEQRMDAAVTGLKNTVGVAAAAPLTDLKDTATGTIAAVNDIIKDGIDEGDGEAIGDAVAAGLQDSLITIENVISQVVPIITEMMPAIFTAISDFVTNNSDQVLDLISSLLNSIIGLIPTLLPMVIDLVVQLVASLAENLPTIIDSLFSALEGIDWIAVGAKLLEGLINGVISAVAGIGEMLSDALQTFWDAVLDFFGIHSPSTLANDAGGNILLGLVNGICDGVEGAIIRVVEGIGRIWQAIKDAFGGGKSEEKSESEQTGADITQGLADGITDDTGTVSTAIHHLAQVAIDSLNEDFGNYNGSSTVAQGIGENIKKSLLTGISNSEDSGFTNAAVSLYNAVATAIKGAFGITQGGFLGMGGESNATVFEDIGKQIVAGIADGVTNNVGLLTSACTMAAQEALQSMKDELGIASPSKVARDLIGKNFGLGIATGIDESLGAISDSASAASALMVASGATTSNTINVNTNVSANIDKQIDIDRLSEKLAWKNKQKLRGVGANA